MVKHQRSAYCARTLPAHLPRTLLARREWRREEWTGIVAKK
jgi:hypothetical protein